MQKQGQEIVDAITVAFADALARFYDTNNRWPDNVVVFRDGVGDGMMEATLKHEVRNCLNWLRQIVLRCRDNFICLSRDTFLQVPQFRKLLRGGHQKMPANYNPGFNYIVVQKRINTRIFSPKPNGEFDNPSAGVILDNSVTR